MSHVETMIKSVLSALALCAAAFSATAQDRIGTPIVGEVLPGWQLADGTRVAALRLTLAPGWKTYWRTPGDAGIPPQFDWSKSSNLRGVGVTWPAPAVFHQSGMRTIGYEDEVILPITIAPRRAGKPVKLKAHLDIGVCRDICVPYQLDLSATLDVASATPTPAIAAALAARPYSASEAGVTAATCALRPTADGLAIETRIAMPSAGGAEVVIIEPGQPGIWMSETKSTRAGTQLVSTGELAAMDGGALAINRSAVKITVLGANHAVEIDGCTPG